MAPSATHLTFVAASVLSLFVVATDAQITCSVVTNPFGAPDEYVLEGAPVGKRGKFPCMVIQNDNPPPSPKEVEGNIGQDQVCNLVKKSHTSYLATTIDDVDEYDGQWCKYECRPPSLRCLATPETNDKTCACMTTGPRPAIVPITDAEAVQLTIQSSSVPESRFCANKEEGDPVADDDTEVDCQRLKLDESPTVLLPTEAGSPMCTKQENPKAGGTVTKFVQIEGGDMACHYVCKKPSAGYKCEKGTPAGAAMCACSKTGGHDLRVPVLVAKDPETVTRMVTRADGSKSFDASSGCFATPDGRDTCGECGRCDAATGACEPVAADGEANVCGCGRVCPGADAVAARPAAARGSPLRCVANRRLGKCGGDGTEVPDLCLESAESDAQDQCVCAKTHREKLGLGADAGRSTCVPLV